MNTVRSVWKNLALSSLTTLVFFSHCFAAEYKIDPSHSQISFKVKHLGISNVRGLFKKFDGTIHFEPNDIASTSAKAEIVVSSIDTDVEKRDKHLVSEDFFHAKKYPQITFVSKEVKEVNGNNFTLVGDLTIHGTTKEVVIDAEFTGAATDPWGNERIAFEGEAKINRKNFGMTWNKVIETGGLVVGEDVKIIIEVEAIKKKAE